MKKTGKIAAALMICLALCLVLLPMKAWAADEPTATSGKCGDNLTWSFNTSTGKLTISGSGDMYDWEGIDDVPWAEYRENIVSVTINNGATSVGERAFYFCSSMKTVIIPSSVQRIGEYAFYSCSAVTRLTVPSGVTKIEKSTFTSCSALVGISLPGSVTSIGESAFSSCGSLKSIIIPDGVTSIGDYAFSTCSALTSVTIPKKVTSIGDGPFAFCQSLKEIIVEEGSASFRSEDGVLYSRSLDKLYQYPAGKDGIAYEVYFSARTIGYSAFGGAKFIESISLPSSLECIGDYAFSSCSGLLQMTVPDSVNYMGRGALMSCTSLKNVVILGEISSINRSTFYSCRGLTSISLPQTVQTIDQSAFYGCKALETVYFAGTEEEWNAISISESNNTWLFNAEIVFRSVQGLCGENLIWVLDLDLSRLEISGSGDMDNWDYTAPWYPFFWDQIRTVVIDSGVTSIGDIAFLECRAIENVTIPETVTSIGKSAFNNCQSLKSITIPASVTSIGELAFCNCLGLTSFTVKAGNTAYTSQSGVLFNAEQTRLLQYPAGNTRSSFQIPDGVKEIAEYAFNNSVSLTSVSIPSGVTSIESGAFCYCTALANIAVPNSLALIGEGAFEYCCNLREIAIPSGVTRIGNWAFSNCNNLREIAIPNGVTVIEYCTFLSCSSLTSVTIPSSVTSIEYGAFRNCSSLTGITIPNSVTSIGKEAFAGCSSLTEVSIPSTVTSIGISAFSNCDRLKAITVAADNPAYCDADGVLFDKDLTILLQYPAGKTDEIYEIPDNSVLYDNDKGGIFFNVGTIEDYAFQGSGNLSSVMIPDTVTNIGFRAFSRSSITSLTIPESVVSLGSNCFFNCQELQSVIIHGNITEIPIECFFLCKSLTHVELPDGLVTIRLLGFSQCESLVNISLPDSLTNIQRGAFINCSSLASLSIPVSVTKVSEGATKGCINLSDVFYEGTGEEWASVSANAGMEYANLFTSEDYNEDLTLDITTEEVPGGVAVTMSAPGGKIYYTLDGTAPCTVSIPYEGTFLLDTPGDWFINAIAIDLDRGIYGDRMTEYVGLEQSGIPTLWEENGAIYMQSSAPEGSIYYSYDLTAEPTAASARYTDPILLTETKTVSARVIEQGKAASPIVSYAFYVTGSGMNYPEDSYSFTNTASSFGYSGIYRIKEERYEEIFGTAAGRMLYEIYGSKWGGSCFGLSATSLMFSSGVLQLGDYSETAEHVNSLTAPKSRDSELTKLIERYQVSQFLPEMMMERNDISSGGNMVISGLSEEAAGDRLLSAVQSACSGGEPIILILWKQQLNGSHAVVPYKLETGKIYLYDSNRPNEENVLTYTRENGSYRFSYGEYSYAVSYNTLSTLLKGLEGLQTGKVSLQADGKEQMLVSLNTAGFEILDEDGKRVEDYLTIRATEDMEQTEETMLYLERGRYTIVNTDGNLGELRISAATEDDYASVTASPGARIGLGTAYGHLYISVKSEGAEEICFHTRNGIGQENEIEVRAEYAKIYACTEMATLIETTATSAVGNGDAVELSQRPDDTTLYDGAIGRFTGDKAREAYDDHAGVRLNTDIGELLPETFTLTANVIGAGERARVFAASYDADGRMTDIRGWETQAGKTKYPFTVPGGTAEVKLLVLDKQTNEPLTEAMTLRQG